MFFQEYWRVHLNVHGEPFQKQILQFRGRHRDLLLRLILQ